MNLYFESKIDMDLLEKNDASAKKVVTFKLHWEVNSLGALAFNPLQQMAGWKDRCGIVLSNQLIDSLFVESSNIFGKQIRVFGLA